jgi:hypothetical protein
MPKLFDHVGEHHPDQNFIFDQEYGCLAEHLAVACGDVESGFVHHDDSVLHHCSKKAVARGRGP